MSARVPPAPVPEADPVAGPAVATEAAARASADSAFTTALAGKADASALTAETVARVAHEATTTAAHGGIVASSDARLTDQRTPSDGSVTNAKVAGGAAIAESKLTLASDAAAGTASRRTLGTSATQAAAGNDNRLNSIVDASAAPVTNQRIQFVLNAAGELDDIVLVGA